MRYIILAICVALQLPLSAYGNQVTPAIPNIPPKTLREQIKELNSASLEYGENYWSTNNRCDYLLKIIEGQWNLQPYHRRRHAFYIINSTTHATQTMVREATTWQDLTMFAGKKPGTNYVGQEICRAKTELGKAQFLSLLAASSGDPKEIARRQTITKTLLANEELHNKLTPLLEACAPSEAFLFSIYGKHDKFKSDLENGYFFTDPIFSYFNDKPLAMTTKHSLDLTNRGVNSLIECIGINTLAWFAVMVLVDQGNPFFQRIARDAARNQRGNRLFRFIFEYLPDIIKAGYSVYSIYATTMALNKDVNWISTELMYEEMLHLKLAYIATAIKTLRTIAQTIPADSPLLTLLPELKSIQQLFLTTKEENEPLHEFINLIQDETFNEENINHFSIDRGKVIVTYRAIHKIRDSLLPALQAFSLLDGYCGIATLMKEQDGRYSFAQLEQADTPHLLLEDFINPLIPADKAIQNSIELGNNAASRNCIITGPNAGGKSTLIKAVGINVLMAQSLGIVAARRAILTPFNFVATYLNITDDINSGNSLFKAEVLRTQELMNALTSLPHGQHGLLIFDEIFNGTTPTEGSVAARVVGEHLGIQTNGTTIIATHFDLLPQLEQLAECSYKNYKVTVKINADGSLSYPFKLEPGISQQHIALDILRAEGYSGTILAKAEELLGTAFTP
jgi:DNA mismatch repair protein MutS